MPYNQPGSSSSAAFGTYNDVNPSITAPQGNVNVQNNITVSNDSNVHSALIRDLKDRLSPSNFARDNLSECLGNTRKETLQRIYQWVDTREYPNVLLLIGAAGTGKSTIATTVAEEYQKRGQLGCRVFFLQGRSHPGDVLQTIAYSLAVYNQSIAESLAEKLRNSGDIDPSSLKTKFEILLREPLSAAATKTYSPILIVLDALDECGTPDTRRSLMSVLWDDLSTLPASFRFLITSRPENDILTFTSLQSSKVETFDLDEQVKESKLDVFTYIKHELEGLRSSKTLRIPQGWPWDENIQSIADIADGLFIWASTAINLVREKQFDQFASLVELAKDRKRLDLNELYTTILENAFKWDEGSKEMFVGVFSFVLFGKSPLSDEDINGILGINTAPDVLMHLRSLVVYSPGNPITIQHASFYDYLISCNGKPWYVDPDVQKSYIASTCFERMGELLKHNICNISSSFALNSDVPDIDNRVTRYIPPFLKYICCNWAHHLQDVSYSQDLCSKLRSFVSKQLLFWFEVLSLTKTFNRHVGPALLFAIGWIGNNDPELSSFLRDAYRQASVYLKPISESVLQIYTSLLPLTKEESSMSKHYAKYSNSAFRVEYIGRRPRNDCIKTIQIGSRSPRISALSFSPDGTRVLSNSKRGVSVWDATSGELIIGPMLAVDDEVDGDYEHRALSAVYLPDGRYIVVASRNGIIRKWDVLINCLVWERVMSDFRIDTRRVESAAFSPDTKSVVFGDDEGTIRVWSVDTGEQDGERLEGHTDSITCLSLSSDGKYLASGSRDGIIIIWDVGKREAKTRLHRRHSSLTAIDFSPCGDNVVSGSYDGTILIWNASTGKVSREIICGSGAYSVAYSPNGLFILAGGGGWMRMWKVTAARKLRGLQWISKRKVAAPKVFQVGSESIERVSFSPDGGRFVSRGSDVIRIWDGSWSVEETKTEFEEQGEIESISVSPDGIFIASASYDGSICLWNVLTGELVEKLNLSSFVYSVTFSPVNEKLIAFGSSDDTVQVWDVTNGELVTIGDHASWVTSVVFSPDGNQVASGSYDKTIRIWNVERRKLEVGPLIWHEGSVYALAYSPDGTRLVSGSADKTVRIWNPATGRLLSTLNGYSDSVNSVAYSLNGSRIVSGSSDKTILVWDPQSGHIVCGPITGHDKGVTSVCFSPDGKQILSGSYDNTARVWDAITGNPLFPPFTGHVKSITSVCLFPDGRRFATGSKDGAIRIWTLDTIPNDTNWELRNDNWVVGEDGKPMMWVPTNLHTHLYRPRNVSIFNRHFYLKLHFGTE